MNVLASQDEHGRLWFTTSIGFVDIHVDGQTESRFQALVDEVVNCGCKSIRPQKSDERKSKEWREARVTTRIEVRDLLGFWCRRVDQVLPNLHKTRTCQNER